MIVISNNIKKIGMEFPIDSVIRINLAWVQSLEEAKKVIDCLVNKDIFLDFPLNRNKYPIPKLSLLESIELANKYDNIKYFAFSNAEDPNIVEIIRKLLNTNIILVPKIETVKGVKVLAEIITKAKTNIVMMDKEDIFTDVKGNNEEFINMIEEIRKHGTQNNVKILELQGVIFSDNK